MLLKTSRPLANNQSCIEYIGLRAKALPLHRPMEFQQEWRNLSTNATAVFTENRPYEAVHYYILVVSNGRVSFDVHIHMNHCGDSGYRSLISWIENVFWGPLEINVKYLEIWLQPSNFWIFLQF